jgi:D-alanine-D-alanine ligase-like ATP-grasp enzyme
MDKAYKKLLGKEKDLENATKKVVKQDKSRDKMVDKAKKMKGKC